MPITAKILADSINSKGNRITTFEVEFHRFVLAEFNTHRMISKNFASSRAITVKRSLELIKENTAFPVHWGKNESGMSAREECSTMLSADSEFSGYTREEWWSEARDMAILHANEFDKKGYHKQIVNRLVENFSYVKGVVTATEYANFFWLRDHEAAQPEIAELAKKMRQEYDNSTPVLLNDGEWHVPYYNDGVWKQSDDMSLSNALKLSSSCCAQVSYRRLNESLEKATELYDRLLGDDRKHASPFEHQATPISKNNRYEMWEPGVTHMDAWGNYWSGNLQGYVQHRQLIPENYKGKL